MFEGRYEQPKKPREEWQGRLRSTFSSWGVDDLCFAMLVVQSQEQNRFGSRQIREVLQRTGLFSQNLAEAREQLDVLTVNYLMDEFRWKQVLNPRRKLGKL